MVEYKILTRHDDPDLIDFINYVFSMDGEATDFVKLLPKAYEPETRHDILHLTLQEEGRIVAAVSILFITCHHGGDALKIGLVGNVSVHPYRRGRGYMKRLMQEADRILRERQCDISALGGQRQRYEYFGYVQAGLQASFTITTDNLRHRLGGGYVPSLTLREPEGVLDALYACYQRQKALCRDRQNFLADCRSWQGELRAVCRDARVIGYVVATPAHTGWLEAVLPPDAYLEAIAAFLQEYGTDQVKISVPLYETETLRMLESFSEYQTLEKSLMLKIFNMERFLTYSLGLGTPSPGIYEIGSYRAEVGEKEIWVRKTSQEEMAADHLFSHFPRKEEADILPLRFWLGELDLF